MRAICELAELAFDDARAGVNEEQLVAAGVAVKVLHRALRIRDREDDVVVAEQRHARFDRVAAVERELRRLEMTIAQRLVFEKRTAGRAHGRTSSVAVGGRR